VWHGGTEGESDCLRSCYVESLRLAAEHRCRSVALPLISSGHYGYPKDQVLRFAVQTITEFLFEHEMTVYLCVYDRESYTFSRALFEDIQDFLKGADERTVTGRLGALARLSMGMDSMARGPLPCTAQMPTKQMVPDGAPSKDEAQGVSLRDFLKEMDKSFQQMLFELIDESGMSDVQCYKNANVDKRTFSKIKSNQNYKPSKQTAIAFAISLHLDIEQTQALLSTAGFALSRSRLFDNIIRYFILNGNYNIFEINEALFEFDQMLLGSA
jgi:hypothetical protein